MISATGVVVNAVASWMHPGRGVGEVDGGFVEQTAQVCVASGRALLAAPQLVVVVVGPARRNRAVDQAHPALDRLEGLARWARILPARSC